MSPFFGSAFESSAAEQKFVEHETLDSRCRIGHLHSLHKAPQRPAEFDSSKAGGILVDGGPKTGRAVGQIREGTKGGTGLSKSKTDIG